MGQIVELTPQLFYPALPDFHIPYLHIMILAALPFSARYMVCLNAMIPALIYLSLGTNMGDRTANLRLAHAELPPEIQVSLASSTYETEPWGFPDQPSFLNQVVQAHTRLSPPALLATLKGIESSLGRRPTFRYGPRLIDLDILLYGNLVIDTPILTIPHPRLTQRAFVLVPLAEIAPDLIHPILGQSIRQLLTQVDTSGVALFTGRLPCTPEVNQ